MSAMPSELAKAFNEMRDTEMALDDMDYLTESPKLKVAMDAAERFRNLLDAHEQAQKKAREKGDTIKGSGAGNTGQPPIATKERP